MTLSDIATDRRSLLKLALLAWGVRSLPVYGAAPPVNSKVDPQQIRNAAGSNNQLSADLYQALGKTPGNLFFSPASIAVALAMTADGAAGQTRQEMFQVLHGDEQADAWLKSMGELAKLLNQSGDGYTLELANRLWGQAGFHFEADYVQRIGQSFDAPLGELPFTSNPEASRGEINRWVSSRTHDRIQDLLPEGSITTLTRMVLTNAIYFKADWADEFDGKRTRDLPFVRTDGSRVDAPMMFQKNHFPYGEDEAVQVLEMPYKSGSLSMVVVLPKQNDGLPKLATSITGEQLERWVSVLRTNEVELTLPKFKLQTQFSLKTTLSELGMARAFSDDAEFTRISKAEPLQISDVIHKAFVEVDEKGTEAAAATGVIVATRAAIITKRIVFQADHPFLFFIRHQETGAILFVGHVSDPRT
ncbi:MAG: serpin family protein [Pirellulaceae bacterium]